MTTINLGTDWVLEVDSANNRLLYTYQPNGSQFELNENGDLIPLDGTLIVSGDFSVNGNALIDGAGVSHSGELADLAENVEGFSTAGASGTVPTSDGAGNLTMSSPTVTKNVFDGNLTTTQTDAENGFNVNFAESVNVNTGFTVNSNSSIDVDNAGTYRITQKANFHRTGSGSRSIMFSEISINGTTISPSRGVCYIRNAGDGDEGDGDASVIRDLSAGDTITMAVGQERGAESGNDLERAYLNVEEI